MTLRLLACRPHLRARTNRLAAGLLLLAASCATQAPRVDPQAWLSDVAWMADDARQGRDTDSPQLVETANWVAQHFAADGLQPLGDNGGWLQHYKVPGTRELTSGNALSVDVAVQSAEAGAAAATAPRHATLNLKLNEDWIPLQSALNGTASGPMVFAGYGLSDPENGWDDYAGLDVKGKVVVVFRRGPHSGEAAARYRDGRGRDRISFVSKVNAAFQHGAAGLLVVNDPLGSPPGSADDKLTAYHALAGGGVAASLPAANVTAAAGARFLGGMGRSLEQIQTDLDAAGKPPRDLPGGNATLTVASAAPQLDTVNVLGMLPGHDPSLANEYVLVGAHMDHLGTGQHSGSRGGPAAVGQIHHGADDNASGSAGVIEVARLLAGEKDSLRRTVVFATWSGEEWGLLGSRHYTEAPALPLDQLVAVVNMDMIGRSKDGYLVVEGMGTSPGFKDLVVGAHDALGLHLKLNLADMPSNNSDHATFEEKQIPVINFFTGLHDDYHMPSDTADKINATGGADIASLAGEVVRRLSRLDTRPPFTPPVGPADGNLAAGPHGPGGPGAPGAPGANGDRANDRPAVVPYRVVFGTSPDMGYQQNDGVRVSSVRKDTPAEKCGVQAGDVIVALDGQAIRNLEDYSVLLFRHHPGDEITVTVKRGDHKLDLKATLAGQAGEN